MMRTSGEVNEAPAIRAILRAGCPRRLMTGDPVTHTLLEDV